MITERRHTFYKLIISRRLLFLPWIIYQVWHCPDIEQARVLGKMYEAKSNFWYHYESIIISHTIIQYDSY